MTQRMPFSHKDIMKRVMACLEAKPPRFPLKELENFVESYFARRHLYLDLAQKHGSPLYVYEPEVLKNRAARFRQVFSEYLPETAYYYAVKSNNFPGVAQTVLELAFGLDVSSGLELEMALSLGAQDIIFSGPGKIDEELRLALEHHESVTVLLDSFGEMKRLAVLAGTARKQIRVGVRLSAQNNGLWRKFGIPPADLAPFYRELQHCPALLFCGLQFHTSWNLGPEAQERFIERLGAVIGSLPITDREHIRFLDIGGGYWPEQGEWLLTAATQGGMLLKNLDLAAENRDTPVKMPAACLETFARRLSSAIKTHIFPHLPTCRICFEPGRWLCNDAMHLLLRVVDVKDRDMVITDGGTNAVGWERFESDYFPVLNLSRPQMKEHRCTLCGSLCTPHDLWGKAYWGEDIQEGDVLLIPTQGAYTYSLRQQFIKPLPSVAVLQEKIQNQNSQIEAREAS